MDWGRGPRSRSGGSISSQACSRSSTRDTCVAVHSPPRAVSMPRVLSPAAMALSEAAPAACSSAMTGARSLALAATLHARSAAKGSAKPERFRAGRARTYRVRHFNGMIGAAWA